MESFRERPWDEETLMLYRGYFIQSAIDVEQQLDSILLKLVQPSTTYGIILFTYGILDGRNLSFSSKVSILNDTLTMIFQGMSDKLKMVNDVITNLKELGKWRNIFAHSKLVIQSNRMFKLESVGPEIGYSTKFTSHYSEERLKGRIVKNEAIALILGQIGDELIPKLAQLEPETIRSFWTRILGLDTKS